MGRYRPIIVGVARKLGLGEEDAADVAQDTLVRFIKSYRAGQYDRSKGRLRYWIIGIARYRILDALRAGASRRGWRGDSLISEMPEEADLNTVWDTERRRAILREAMVELRAHTKIDQRTIAAFEMVAFHRRRPCDVADELHMTLDDVYQVKNRIAARLREITAKLESIYDEDECG